MLSISKKYYVTMPNTGKYLSVNSLFIWVIHNLRQQAKETPVRGHP